MGRIVAQVRVEALSDFPGSIDEAAEAADPRHAFLRRAWFAAAGGANAATLVASRQDGAALAALPTVAVGPRWLGVRAVPGSYWPIRSFPISAEMDDAELIALFASPAAGRTLGGALRVGPVNADDPSVERLLRAAPAAGWTTLIRRVATSFTLDIAAAREAGPWPRGSTLRKNRFHEKHLAEHGALDWRFLSGPDWSPDLFGQLASIERASWIGGDEGADAKFMDPAQRAFWERAAADPALAAMMHVGLLSVGGSPAAFSFGIEAGRTRYCIATSFNRRFAKHSPGKLVTYRTYLDAAERGITFLDDGAGDGGHKSVIGETAGPEIVDLLLVRSRALAIVLRPIWERSGQR